MGAVISTLRGLMIAGMIASVGFAGVCPCSAHLAGGTSSRHAAGVPQHICPCVLKTGRCCCGAACHCGQQAPQRENEPVAPSSSNDRSQPIALVAYTATLCGTIAAVGHAKFSAASFSAESLSLVAQGTRLNI